jgi:hypothetical protein
MGLILRESYVDMVCGRGCGCGWSSVVSSCEDGNEPVGAPKVCEFRDKLSADWSSGNS